MVAAGELSGVAAVESYLGLQLESYLGLQL